MHTPQELAQLLDAALPQTQCTRCGYPDCHAYANAMALEQAPINQCPPGGAEGVRRLAALTGQAATPLNPNNGAEGPRAMAIIDEQWCIGCTLCLKACPVDAIVGANKTMHTVLEAECTGCELCIPVCPVDCIVLEPMTGAHTGWQAWSPAQAQQALHRYVQRADRLGLTVGAQQAPLHQRSTLHSSAFSTAAATFTANDSLPNANPSTPETMAAQNASEQSAQVTAETVAPSKAQLLAEIMKKAQARRAH
ncbi:RnfABCDGE type electron transport complex subunit B [Lampropedia puyangensis]|uniref:RnfABCDGE type electron transport complex subunit B n=1 Tax=Lampropedia puyangensis TaxID=1330072 RepID=A0A4S8F2T1_9BURK|nr:RnfABCDGE type electron transport complex subunit B [Lampropedia puyangensis]THU01051.1 RnfABCDGE type electron transport complex subunit B [Lampropedia puyangensis]